MRFCSLGCSTSLRHSLTTKRPDAATLRRLYEEEVLSVRKIAALYEVGPTAVSRWLREGGIQARDRPEGFKSPGSALANRPSPEALRDMYEVRDLTAQQIAGHLGVGESSVLRWLQASGIAAKKAAEAPDRDDLCRLAHSEHRSAREIGEVYGVGFNTVHRWLRELGIPPIDGWDVRKKGNRIPPPDAETLRSLYESGKTLEEIGDTYGVTPAPVAIWCRRHGIEIREGGYNYNHGERYVCNDGARVRSSYEKRVADWLHSHSIPYEYEPKLPFKTRFRGDFLANGWYIEVWGIRTDPRYCERKERKKLAYRSHGVPMFGLSQFHFLTASTHLLERHLSRCLVPPSSSGSR
jgi:transposase